MKAFEFLKRNYKMFLCESCNVTFKSFLPEETQIPHHINSRHLHSDSQFIQSKDKMI